MVGGYDFARVRVNPVLIQKHLKYIRTDERVLNIREQFDSRVPVEYIPRLANNNQMY